MTSLREVEERIARLEDKNLDDPRLIELNELANELAAKETAADDAFKANMAAREIEQRELAFKERINSKGGNYLKWLAWAESLYPITEEDGEFTFISNAAKWKVPEDHVYGPYAFKIEALEYIEKLINTKISDRNRGLGDMNKDLAKFNELTKEICNG